MLKYVDCIVGANEISAFMSLTAVHSENDDF